MKVITLACQKGGVGKSTTAINIAAELHRRGYKVALLETDSQGTVEGWTVNREEGKGPLAAVIEPSKVKAVIENAKLDSLDFVVFDTAPSRHESDVRSAIEVADLVLVPMGPSAADAKASMATASHVKNLKRKMHFVMCKAKPASGFTETRRTTKFMKVMSQFAPVCEIVIHDRVGLLDAYEAGLGITEAGDSKAADEIIKLTTWIEGIVK